MSPTYRISKSKPGEYTVLKNGKEPSNLNASDLRQLCQTMGKSYAHLISELQNQEVVELKVAHEKIQKQ
jgi:hypothetical protein